MTHAHRDAGECVVADGYDTIEDARRSRAFDYDDDGQLYYIEPYEPKPVDIQTSASLLIIAALLSCLAVILICAFLNLPAIVAGVLGAGASYGVIKFFLPKLRH